MGWLGERTAANWLWCSVCAFLLFAAIETLRPDDRTRTGPLPRWLSHLGLYAADMLLASAVLPAFVFALVTDRTHEAAIGPFAFLEAVGGPWAVLLAGLERDRF